jgi:hypothetical protein
MRIQLKKKDDPTFISNGSAVLYKNFIEFSTTESFDTLSKTLIKKHKLNATEVLAKEVQLNYQVDRKNSIVYVVLNRTLADANNFSSNLQQYIELIKNKIYK